MKPRRWLILAIVLLALSAAARAGSPAIVTGPLRWTRASTCEWPPGTFVQYYVQGCRLEDQIFIAGERLPADGSAAGLVVWATGSLIRNGGCQILDATDCKICVTPVPADVHR